MSLWQRFINQLTGASEQLTTQAHFDTARVTDYQVGRHQVSLIHYQHGVADHSDTVKSVTTLLKNIDKVLNVPISVSISGQTPFSETGKKVKEPVYYGFEDVPTSVDAYAMVDYFDHKDPDVTIAVKAGARPDTIIHELGHALDYLSYDDPTQSRLSNSSDFQKLYRFYVAAFDRYLEQAPDTLRDTLLSDVDYATDPSEVFARFFATWYSDKLGIVTPKGDNFYTDFTEHLYRFDNNARSIDTYFVKTFPLLTDDDLSDLTTPTPQDHL